MANFQIEKYIGSEAVPKSFDKNHSKYDWVLAWGFKPRTYPKVLTKTEAIEVFKKETSRVRKGSLRLKRITSGLGFNTSSSVLYSVNCCDSESYHQVA